MAEIKEALARLVRASEPFTSSDIVDETGGTMLLMQELTEAIKQAKEILDG